MAPLCLLTGEQLQRNLEAFKLKGVQAGLILNSWETGIVEAVTRASAVNLPEQPCPAPTSVETFRDPKLHLNVLSTFLATSMSNVNYVPNASYEGIVDAAQEAKGFADLLSDLQRFGSYMPLVATVKRRFSHDAAAGCEALLQKIYAFIGESGIQQPTIVIKDLAIARASLTSCREEPTMTLFVGYHLQGADSNPELFVFYGTAKMVQEEETGESVVAAAEQTVETAFYRYRIASRLVSSMAEELAIITVVPAEALTEFVNRRFPSSFPCSQE